MLFTYKKKKYNFGKGLWKFFNGPSAHCTYKQRAYIQITYYATMASNNQTQHRASSSRAVEIKIS